MMKAKPLRINYYERYQKIIEEYNADNEKYKIAIIFELLMNLAGSMNAEQRRYASEGFNSDEELTVYEMLFKDSLTKEEIKQVKALAQTMLIKIKAKIHKLDHWTDKEETCGIIDTMIRDMLYTDLPLSYDDAALTQYRRTLYEYFYSAYPAA